VLLAFGLAFLSFFLPSQKGLPCSYSYSFKMYGKYTKKGSWIRTALGYNNTPKY
jgi:hypothetical protein